MTKPDVFVQRPGGPGRVESVVRLLQLADRLDTVSRRRFDQRHWKRWTWCGTARCIGGYACDVVPEELRLEAAESGVRACIRNTSTNHWGAEGFADAFGLDNAVAQDLTAATAPHQTPADAARAVRMLADEMARVR